LKIRLNQRHKVSSCTTGTGDFKTRKHTANQFPAGFSTEPAEFGDRGAGRLGRPSLRRRAELGAGKGWQKQSPQEAAPPSTFSNPPPLPWLALLDRANRLQQCPASLCNQCTGRNLIYMLKSPQAQNQQAH